MFVMMASGRRDLATVMSGDGVLIRLGWWRFFPQCIVAVILGIGGFVGGVDIET